MEVMARLVIGERHVERAVGFDQVHHQALGIRSCSGLLLEYRSFLDYMQRLRSGNATLCGTHEGMVAPFDPLCIRCSADCGEVESHGGKDIWVA